MVNEDRPLVTIALLAYNQERYIREAVESVLAQDYSPLEVILSDDGSADSTFEMIKDIASRYSGPHYVIARQTERNQGSLLHVAEVAALAKGGLLILAAGDDVSKPNRARVLTTAWQDFGAWGLCSRFDRIDESGTVLETSAASGVLAGHGFKDFFYANEGPIRIVHGCTSAYDARAFEYLRLMPEDYILSEDGAMSVLLNLLGKNIVNLDDSLVLYRESQNSITNSRGRAKLSYAQIVEDEVRMERFAAAQANRCRLFLRMNQYLGSGQVRRMKVEEVKAELRRQTMRAGWREILFVDRLSFALTDQRSSWALPRMFGLKLFFAAKWLARHLRGGRNE